MKKHYIKRVHLTTGSTLALILGTSTAHATDLAKIMNNLTSQLGAALALIFAAAAVVGVAIAFMGGKELYNANKGHGGSAGKGIAFMLIGALLFSLPFIMDAGKESVTGSASAKSGAAYIGDEWN